MSGDVYYFTSSSSSVSLASRERSANKVVFIGNVGVGKTTLIEGIELASSTPPLDADTFARTLLDTKRPATIGVDYCRVTLPTGCVALLWDTAGQERFAPLLSTYIHKSALIVLVYSLERDALAQLVAYESLVRTELDSSERGARRPVRVLVVGARRDLVRTSSLDDSAARAFATTLGADYCVVSARSLDSFRRRLIPALVRALGDEPPRDQPNIVNSTCSC